MQAEKYLLCVTVAAGNLGFKYWNLKGEHQKFLFWRRKINEISACNNFSSSVLSVTKMTFWVWQKYIVLLLQDSLL